MTFKCPIIAIAEQNRSCTSCICNVIRQRRSNRNALAECTWKPLLQLMKTRSLIHISHTFMDPRREKSILLSYASIHRSIYKFLFFR